MTATHIAKGMSTVNATTTLKTLRIRYIRLVGVVDSAIQRVNMHGTRMVTGFARFTSTRKRALGIFCVRGFAQTVASVRKKAILGDLLTTILAPDLQKIEDVFPAS